MKSYPALDVIQMKELQDLGCDCSNASMCWVHTEWTRSRLHLLPDPYCLHLVDKECVPAYTLEDLLLKLYDKGITSYSIECTPDYRITVNYTHSSGRTITTSACSLLYSAFDALKQCIELGLTKEKVEPTYVMSKEEQVRIMQHCSEFHRKSMRIQEGKDTPDAVISEPLGDRINNLWKQYIKDFKEKEEKSTGLVDGMLRYKD